MSLCVWFCEHTEGPDTSWKVAELAQRLCGILRAACSEHHVGDLFQLFRIVVDIPEIGRVRNRGRHRERRDGSTCGAVKVRRSGAPQNGARCRFRALFRLGDILFTVLVGLQPRYLRFHSLGLDYRYAFGHLWVNVPSPSRGSTQKDQFRQRQFGPHESGVAQPCSHARAHAHPERSQHAPRLSNSSPTAAERLLREPRCSPKLAEICKLLPGVD